MQPANATDIRGGPSGSENPNSDPSQTQGRKSKRFQACVACRATKTKCLPTDQSDSCQACIRNNRPCIAPGPAKPRMKSAQKFSELEKKIEMLTSALAGRDHGLQTMSDTSSTLRRPSGTLQSPSTSSTNSDHLEYEGANDFNTSLSPETMHAFDQTRLDALDDSFMTKDITRSLFNHWNANMRRFMPLVSPRPDLDLDQIRQSRPVLFLAILTVASASVYPAVADQLVKRLTNEIGRQVFVEGTQSIDLILATLLFSHYYFPSQTTNNLAPTQYVYAAVAMSSDMGLHAKARTITSASAGVSSGALEAARVCLSEWFAASTIHVDLLTKDLASTATQLQRSTLVRHSADLERYAQYLQKEQNSSDTWLISLVRLQQIMEGASVLLDSSDTKDASAFDEPNTQYKITVLRQQLEKWEMAVPAEVDNRLKKHGFHTAYLHIHEVAIRAYIRKMSSGKTVGKSGSTQTEAGMGLTPSHFDCLTKCLTSIKALFDIYLSFEPSLARCLPNSYLFWNITAAVQLIKLGQFGEILTKLQHSNSTFEATILFYLDTVAARLDELSQDSYLPQAKSHVTVLRKLKPYYLSKRTGQNILGRKSSQHDQSMTGYLNSPTPTLPSNAVQDIGDHSIQHHQATSANTSLSQDHWISSPASFSQHSLRTPSDDFSGQFSHPEMGMYAAYDPSVYASTDWNMFSLGADAIQQLDSFMWAEEDTAWMQSLL